MKSAINFDNVVSSLKRLENATVKEEVFHDKGIYREVMITIPPYDVKIEYIDVGKHHTPLNFYAKKGDEPEIKFDSIRDFSEFFGIKNIES